MNKTMSLIELAEMALENDLIRHGSRCWSMGQGRFEQLLKIIEEGGIIQ